MAIIGIDVTALSTPASGGIGTSQYQTMRALAELPQEHHYLLYAAAPPLIPFTREPLDLQWKLRLGSGQTTRSNVIWMQTGINDLLARDGVDLFWSPRHLLPLRAHGFAKVATIQDFWHRYFPDQQPWLNRTMNRELIARVIAQSDRVVTASQATADDVMRFHSVAASRIDVVALGVDTTQFAPSTHAESEAVLTRLGITEPYVLSLDVFNPRKNFSAVLEAVSRLPEKTRSGIAVVGVGRPRKTASEVDPYARSVALGLSEHVRILDDVDAGDLQALYSGALAFVYPSVYEGFGMPVLEAMACGCPVITSNRSSLPEVAGDAALLVDPTSADEIAAAITLLLEDGDKRRHLRAAGLARAAHFTWRRTAEGMLASFDRALATYARGGNAS